MEMVVLSGGGGAGIKFHPFTANSSLTNKNKNQRCYIYISSTATNTTKFVRHNNNSKPSNIQIAITTNSNLSRQAAILDIQRSSNLDSALQRHRQILQVQDLNVILRYFGNVKRWKDVSQIFDWMKKHEKISFTSYSSFIKYMGKGSNPVKALEAYDGIRDESLKTNVSICNATLGCLVKNGKFQSGIKLFSQMKQSGLVPDAITYSTLLAGCTKDKDGYAKALQLVQEMKDNDLRMDDVIYGTILAVCASNNRCKDAEAFFQQMMDEGLKPNIFHYSSLLNAYSVDGNHTKAECLVKDMKSAGLAPNKVMLTTLLKVYVRGGLFEKSRELLVELEALGYAQDEMPYCLLMDGLAKAGEIHEAKLIFHEMEKKDVKSDGYAHSIMISAFCRNGLFEDAKQLAKDFEAKHDKYDLVMLNTILRAYCKAGEMESVMQMMRKMDELKISPDWNTYHILIKYFSKEKLYQLAYRTMVDMHSKGLEPDEELCSSLILHLGRVGAPSEAFSLYNILRYGKRTMRKALHEKMLKILVAGGLLKDAYVIVKDNAERISHASLNKFSISFMKTGNINLINDVLKALHGPGHKIDQEVFRLAISRYIEEPEKKELLLQLLHWMTGQGYIVDSSSRNLLLKNSDLFGRHLISEALSKQHKMLKVLRTQERTQENSGADRVNM